MRSYWVAPPRPCFQHGRGGATHDKTFPASLAEGSVIGPQLPNGRLRADMGGDRSAQCRTDIGARSLKQKKKGRLCGLPIFASGGALLAEKKSARSSSFGRLRGLVGATPPDTAQASAAEGQFKDMSQVCVARRRRGPQPPLSPSLSLVAYLKMSPAGCHRGSVLACGTRLCGAPGIRSS